MSDKNKVILIKNTTSKQIDDKTDELFSFNDGVIEPEVGFEELLYAYDSSSIISGIIKKISAKVDSGFVKTENERARKSGYRYYCSEFTYFLKFFLGEVKKWK